MANTTESPTRQEFHDLEKQSDNGKLSRPEKEFLRNRATKMDPENFAEEFKINELMQKQSPNQKEVGLIQTYLYLTWGLTEKGTVEIDGIMGTKTRTAIEKATPIIAHGHHVDNSTLPEEIQTTPFEAVTMGDYTTTINPKVFKKNGEYYKREKFGSGLLMHNEEKLHSFNEEDGSYSIAKLSNPLGGPWPKTTITYYSADGKKTSSVEYIKYSNYNGSGKISITGIDGRKTTYYYNPGENGKTEYYVRSGTNKTPVDMNDSLNSNPILLAEVKKMETGNNNA